MLFCKQVANALADERYWKLPFHRRIGLRMHVMLCAVCGQYHRQVMFMQRAADEYLKHEQEDPPPAEMSLSPQARDRIQTALKNPPS